MISKELCEKIILRAMKTGADYAEIYAEDKTASSVSMIDGAVENSVSSRDRGVGIRVFKNTNYVYAYGNDISEKGLNGLADKVAAAVGECEKKQADIKLESKIFAPVCEILVPGSDILLTKKIEDLKIGYFAAKNYASQIVQVRASMNCNEKDVLVANSEGVYGKDKRSYVRVFISAVASDGIENQSGTFSPGNHSGYEFIDALDLKAGGEFAARQAMTMLKASKCPAGKMPVVMGNGFGGVIFHEACGHSLEATSVAKGNSVFCGKLGQKIASEKVTAYDDGTMKNSWGSLSMSDEGEDPSNILLIENGILKNYMIDKLGARRMNMPSTGSGRRQSYEFAPTSRMTNTYIAPGTDKIDDMFASVDYGLYAAHMGGGSVNPITGEFNFAVVEGYMIRNGKVCEPVRGATLIGKGSEILNNIYMVSDNLELAQGMCGSSSGSVPTNVGQPAIAVSDIVVGGEA